MPKKFKHNNQKRKVYKSVAHAGANGKLVQSARKGVFRVGGSGAVVKPQASSASKFIRSYVPTESKVQQVAPRARAVAKPSAKLLQLPRAGSAPGQQQRHTPDFAPDWVERYARNYHDITGRDPMADAKRVGKKVFDYLKDWHSGEQRIPARQSDNIGQGPKKFDTKRSSIARDMAAGGKEGYAFKTNHSIAQSARAMIMAAPAAYSIAPPMTGFNTMTGTGPSKDGITISGCDYLGVVTPNNAAGTGSNQVAGSYLLNLDINPGVLGIPRVAQLASLFEQFHFKKFIIYYASACGTDTPGAMAAFTETDPDDVLSPDLQMRIKQLFGHAKAASSSFFTPARFNVICKKGQFYVDPGPEERLTVQAHFNALVLSPDTTSAAQGVWFCEYELELWRSRVDGATGNSGAQWGITLTSTASDNNASPFGTNFVAQANQTVTYYQGNNLEVTCSVGTGPFNIPGNLITVNTNSPVLVRMIGTTTMNAADTGGYVTLGLTNALPTYVDSASNWNTLDYGAVQTAAKSATNYALRPINLATGPGITVQQYMVASSATTVGGSSQDVVLWPANVGQIEAGVTFWVYWSLITSTTQSFGSNGTPAQIGRASSIQLEVIALNQTVSLTSIKRLRVKTQNMERKMQALMQEVEMAQTLIQKLEDEKENRQHDEDDGGGGNPVVTGAAADASEFKDGGVPRRLRVNTQLGLGGTGGEHGDLCDPQDSLGFTPQDPKRGEETCGRWVNVTQVEPCVTPTELSDLKERPPRQRTEVGVRESAGDDPRKLAVERARDRLVSLHEREQELRAKITKRSLSNK